MSTVAYYIFVKYEFQRISVIHWIVFVIKILAFNQELFAIVASVLHLGNVTFEEEDHVTNVVKSDHVNSISQVRIPQMP